MNDPARPDFPERDPALDAAWRAHSTELPPPRIDAALRAAAYREVGARPRAVDDDDALAEAREPSRWWWGLAAAATIGAIAFGVLQLAPQPDDPMVASDMPRADAKSEEFARAPASLPPAAPGEPQRERAAAAPTDAPTITARSAPSARSDATASVVAPSTPKTEAPAATRPMPSAAVGRAAPTAPPSPAAPRTAEPQAAPPAASPQREQGSSPMLADSAPPTGTMDMRERAQAPALASAVPPERDNATPRPFPGTANEASKPALARAAPMPRELADEAGVRQAPSAAAGPAEAAKRRAESPAAAGTIASAPRAGTLPSSTEWVERIRAYFDARRFDEAARELNAFRDAYPDADAQLPERLRDWAASVSRPR